MSSRGPSARFTEEHKTVLKEIITGDQELTSHIIYQSISSKERQSELWKQLIETFNEQTGQNYVKEQITNCLSRIKRSEIAERQRRLEEGEEIGSDLWLTLDQQDPGLKYEPRASPASFNQADINMLKDIITGDSEIRGVIFHGNPSENKSCDIWARLVDKFNLASGRNYNKNQIYRCLSRLKYREKNKEKIAAKEKSNGVVKKARQGRPKKVPKKEDFITDESEVSEDGEWLPPSNTGTNSARTSRSSTAAARSTNTVTTAALSTAGLDNIFGMIKGEAIEDDEEEIEDDFSPDQFNNIQDDIDWTNPLTGYLKAMTPGIRLNQRLQKTNYDLQMENQRLINQKLKLDFRDGLRSDM